MDRCACCVALLAALLVVVSLGCELVAGIQERSLAPPATPDAACLQGEGVMGGWPDSATLFCSDGVMAVSCADASVAPGQDGRVLGDVPTYTKVALPVGSGVRDAITALVWERGAAPSPLTWDEARARCDAQGGGFRLPTRDELVSLLDYGRDGPAMDDATFLVPTALTDLYWTSTSSAEGSSAWVVGVDDGRIETLDVMLEARVRCVIGEERASCMRTSDGGETLIDDRTGITWQREPVIEPMTWLGALAFCDALTLDGATGYRLPSAKELASLAPPLLDEPGRFWSSSPVAASPAEAWFFVGGAGLLAHAPTTDAARVRCVR